MRAVGIILAGGNSFRMKELSNKRAIAAMPIAGSFRSIDFALSSMSNSQYSAGSGVDTVQFQIAESASELFEMVGFRKKAGWTVRISTDGYFGQ